MSRRSRCPICGRYTVPTSFAYRNSGTHGHHLFDDRTLLRCGRCDSMWCPDPPTSAELADYYATSYTPAMMGPVDNEQWPIWDTRPASLIVLARLFVDFKPGSLFIDVGPGNGASLSLAPLLLPLPSLGCVEFNRRSIDFFERQVDELRVAASMDEFDARSATIVYSAHSLEHFRPDEALTALRSIHRTLRRGGALTLEVPRAPSARALGAGRRHTPHLLFFSLQGLERLLLRAGFEVRMICTTRGRPGNKAVAERMARGDLSPQLSARLEALNTGDLFGLELADTATARGALKCVAVKRD